jgi:hypothetical protein
MAELIEKFEAWLVIDGEQQSDRSLKKALRRLQLDMIDFDQK